MLGGIIRRPGEVAKSRENPAKTWTVGKYTIAEQWLLCWIHFLVSVFDLVTSFFYQEYILHYLIVANCPENGGI